MFLQSDHSLNSVQIDDDELWLRYLEGNEQALSRIFLRYYTRLFRYGVNLIGNECSVKDGIQELFLILWRKRDKISKAQSVEFYLLYSLRRILLRQKARGESLYERNQKYLEETEFSLHSVEEIIVLREQENERYQLFLKAQESLSNRQKEILYLRLQHGLTNKEISEFLDISMQRVKNCMYESIKLLREKVYKYSVEKPV